MLSRFGVMVTTWTAFGSVGIAHVNEPAQGSDVIQVFDQCHFVLTKSSQCKPASLPIDIRCSSLRPTKLLAQFGQEWWSRPFHAKSPLQFVCEGASGQMKQHSGVGHEQ